MSKKKKTDSEGGGTTADAFETTPTPSPALAKKEACVSLAELIAMKKVPDHHALAMKVYAGTDGEKPLSEWMDLYEEMMSKPNDVPQKKWHAEFRTKKAR